MMKYSLVLFRLNFASRSSIFQYLAIGMKCLAQGHNTAPPDEDRTRDLVIESDPLPTELSVLPSFSVDVRLFVQHHV